MIFATNWMFGFIIASNDADMLKSNELTLTIINNDDIKTKICYGSFSDLIDSFNKISSNEFYTFNNRIFHKFLYILRLYPSMNEKKYSIPFINYLKKGSEYSSFFEKIFGQRIPSIYNTTQSSKKKVVFRIGLGIERILDVQNSMIRLRNYKYHKIFSYACDDNLLLSITLSALVENIGITYLRLLSENPYYRDNTFFTRDFIVHSASFLHSINVIYKYSLDDDKIMNFFRVFAVKNIKLLRIFKSIWEVSYESILKKLNDSTKNFVIKNKNLNINTVINPNNSKKKCYKLEEFNFEIHTLFEFISKINLNPKFKNEFKILETSSSYSSYNLPDIIKSFDEEGLLEFFTKKCDLEKNGEEIKDPAYFLNSLDMEYFIPDSILTNIESKLLFIENQSIKKYFIEMLWISYSGNFQQLMQKIEHMSNKRKSINANEEPSKKHFKLFKFDCNLQDNVQPKPKIVENLLHHVQPTFIDNKKSANNVFNFKQEVGKSSLSKLNYDSDDEETLYLYFNK